MPNRIPFETVYFCGNCEDEVSGMPAGSRIYSGRPLCLRCTYIGLEEGWAESQEQAPPDKRICSPTHKPGMIILGFFLLAIVAFISCVTVFFLQVTGGRRE